MESPPRHTRDATSARGTTPPDHNDRLPFQPGLINPRRTARHARLKRAALFITPLSDRYS